MILELSGPFPLNKDEIERVVPKWTGGAFAVGLLNAQGGLGVITAIGRSDTDLLSEIRRAIGRYEVFLFSSSGSANEAFELECRLFHRLKYRPDLRHPVASPGVAWTCATCAFEQRMKRLDVKASYAEADLAISDVLSTLQERPVRLPVASLQVLQPPLEPATPAHAA